MRDPDRRSAPEGECHRALIARVNISLQAMQVKRLEGYADRGGWRLDDVQQPLLFLIQRYGRVTDRRHAQHILPDLPPQLPTRREVEAIVQPAVDACLAGLDNHCPQRAGL